MIIILLRRKHLPKFTWRALLVWFKFWKVRPPDSFRFLSSIFGFPIWIRTFSKIHSKFAASHRWSNELSASVENEVCSPQVEPVVQIWPGMGKVLTFAKRTERFGPFLVSNLKIIFLFLVGIWHLHVCWSTSPKVLLVDSYLCWSLCRFIVFQR